MASSLTLSAVVLAGGRSSRMGRAKATLKLGGATLIERLLGELERVASDIVVVAAPETVEPFPLAAFVPARAPVRVVRDEVAFSGPLAALGRGLAAARHEVAFACSCDLPLLSADVVRALCGMIGRYDAVIPRLWGRLQPLQAAYRARCAETIAMMVARGERQLSALASVLDARVIEEEEYRRFDPELLSPFNLNTPEDFARALSLLGKQKGATR